MAVRPVRRHPHLWFLASFVTFGVGVLYFALPARLLPLFLPGHAAGEQTHLISNAAVSGFVAIVLFVVGMASTAADNEQRRRASRRIRNVPSPRRDD